uniref:Plexin C1 n=1 Tax=Leptobrachium leishanense TaxID=445787 RepID=A0A8C5PRN3_9ANUR
MTLSRCLVNLLLFLFLIADPVYNEDAYSFRYPVNNIAIGEKHVVVATENCLYKFDHTLQLLSTTGANDNYTPACKQSQAEKTSAVHQTATFYNMLLLIFKETVLSCWNQNGTCNERRLNKIETLIGSTPKVVYCDKNYPAVGIDYYVGNSFRLFVATYAKSTDCMSEVGTAIRHISVRQNNDGILANVNNENVNINKDAWGIRFVDGFSLDNKLFFTYSISSSEARMAILKQDNGIAFHKRVKLICRMKSQPMEKILSAAKFSAFGGHFYAGIFTPNDIGTSLKGTALCIFDLTDMSQEGNDCLEQDFGDGERLDLDSCKNDEHFPVNQTATLGHGNLSAIHAVEVNKRIVFYLGTGDGQVLKATLDANWKASCPQILHEFDGEAPMVYKIKGDPVNSSFIYALTRNQIRRIKVEKCERFESCKECMLAEDPHCGWCHSQKRCTLKTECDSSECLDINAVPLRNSQVKITVKSTELLPWRCTLKNLKKKGENLCTGQSVETSGNCSCSFFTNQLTDMDQFTVEMINNKKSLTEIYQFKRCSQLQSGCLDCVTSGCLWCNKDSKCTSPLHPCMDYANLTTCKDTQPPISPGYTILNISIQPERISNYGKKNVIITGEGLQNLSQLVLIGTSSCGTEQLNIIPINNTQANVSLPPSTTGTKGVCVEFHNFTCSKTEDIHYAPPPSCVQISPGTSWHSGGRNINITGHNMDLVDSILLSSKNSRTIPNSGCTMSYCPFVAPQFSEDDVTIYIRVEEHTIRCGNLLYRENPDFTSFNVINDINDELELRIKKKNDDLNIQQNEIQVQVHYSNNTLSCKVHNLTQNADETALLCKMRKLSKDKIIEDQIKVTVILGEFKKTLENKSKSFHFFWYILLALPLLIVVILAACFVTRYKARKLSKKLRNEVELLESQIRQEIRAGFAELQMEKNDLNVQSLGTIPFFDYKHVAINILFPEVDEGRLDFSERILEFMPPLYKSRQPVEGDNVASVLRKMFENKNFLMFLIHTMEKQSSFSVKDRCIFASYLTIGFQNNLVYLTEVMEDLLRHLMDQPSNKHPKLLLRRTESVVEKLLTNWMSTCLYGFLRESVGEQLYLLVCTLNQRIHKGPIDAVNCRALYTLNEDWLLWQISDFNIIELNVNFPVITENEDESNRCITVPVLDCDTIGQTKEKILQRFLEVKGYPHRLHIIEIGLEFHHGQTLKELLDIDSSSVVLENGIKKLNTIKYYKIGDGATINVIKKQCIDFPDYENPKLYCHLVAIHAAVEKLFRSIWTLPAGRPPVAIKYFFDFLDAQAENKKITDPDVLHIWKTNSLPLRFWINILKNPHFVFDIRKTPLLDSCLSVIAQAFMDGFSLTEHQLGKSAPTNKLLYAKDIPQFKEEIKAYYKGIRDAPTVSPAELKEFLTQESKKHEHEFKEDVPFLELYKYIERYSDVIISSLENEPGFEAELGQLLHVRKVFEDKKKCKWE